ncbi:hypothetical protein H0A66_12145 [Alcaligenaceae bacterium]|nr:hypothetical protein [Alcaligenaceae bacterium]
MAATFTANTITPALVLAAQHDAAARAPKPMRVAPVSELSVICEKVAIVLISLHSVYAALLRLSLEGPAQACQI